MGRREFYAWCDQLYRELSPQVPTVDRWTGVDNDEWWQQARARRAQRQGRG